MGWESYHIRSLGVVPSTSRYLSRAPFRLLDVPQANLSYVTTANDDVVQALDLSDHVYSLLENNLYDHLVVSSVNPC